MATGPRSSGADTLEAAPLVASTFGAFSRLRDRLRASGGSIAGRRMDFSGFQWISVVFNGFRWNSSDFELIFS